MKKKYRETNLSGVMQIGKEPEREPSPAERGHFDKNLYFVIDDDVWGGFFFPWEWIYMPDIVEYAKECGIEIPDGTVDLSKTF